MTEPTNSGVPEHADPNIPDTADVPTADATQAIPSAQTQAIPSAYSYPESTATSAADEPDVPEAPVPTPIPAAPSAPAAAAAETAAPAGVTLADDPTGGSGSGGGKRKGLLIGGLAAVVVLGGLGAFAAQKLSGGGARPADVLPGDAFAYVQVDIDPSAGQKVAAVRFLNKLPQLKDFETGDARKKLWDMAVSDADNDCIKKFSYDNDIAPWLGDRVGVAVRPGGTDDEPNAVVALQVKDESAATQTISKLAACDDSGDDSVDITSKDGYVLFTNKGQKDATLAAIGKGTLASNANFKSDMDALGEQGIVSAWFDAGQGMKELSNVAGAALGMQDIASQDVKGRFAAALRFDPSYIELAGIARGVEGTQGIKPAAGNGAELVNLPDDTAAALHVSGAGDMISQAWPQISKQIEDAAAADGQDDILSQIEDQFDVKLPDDLKVLLGSSFTVALPEAALTSDEPLVGGKIVTTDAKRADEIVGTIEDATGATGMVKRSVDGDKLYLATSDDYLAKLKSGGKLGDSEAFKAALGDAGKANVALFVNLDKIEKNYLDALDGDAKSVVEAIRAVGLSASNTGTGEASYSFRVVAN